MKPADRKKWGAVLALLALAALLTAGVIWMRNRGLLALFSSPERLQEYVRGFGPTAPIIFFALQAVQVILSPIPGNVTTLAGGALFGFWKAFLISSAAVVVGSLAAFGLARLFGRPLVVRLVGEKTVGRYLDALISRQRILIVLFFLLPFFPDDALCLIAGLTGLGWGFFTLTLILTRPWGLLFSALVGSGAIAVPVWGWALIAAASLALIAASAKWGQVWERWLLERVKRSAKKSG
ncbi:MAG: TVP38/TMEM64 family protein [Clostridiales bacterium]|nr:TVP38/TMEM64 family protein [Clostridiales bacterium]